LVDAIERDECGLEWRAKIIPQPIGRGNILLAGLRRLDCIPIDGGDIAADPGGRISYVPAGRRDRRDGSRQGCNDAERRERVSQRPQSPPSVPDAAQGSPRSYG
jgi:hypothetical protein